MILVNVNNTGENIEVRVQSAVAGTRVDGVILDYHDMTQLLKLSDPELRDKLSQLSCRFQTI